MAAEATVSVRGAPGGGCLTLPHQAVKPYGIVPPIIGIDSL